MAFIQECLECSSIKVANEENHAVILFRDLHKHLYVTSQVHFGAKAPLNLGIGARVAFLWIHDAKLSILQNACFNPVYSSVSDHESYVNYMYIF